MPVGISARRRRFLWYVCFAVRVFCSRLSEPDSAQSANQQNAEYRLLLMHSLDELVVKIQSVDATFCVRRSNQPKTLDGSPDIWIDPHAKAIPRYVIPIATTPTIGLTSQPNRGIVCDFVCDTVESTAMTAKDTKLAATQPPLEKTSKAFAQCMANVK